VSPGHAPEPTERVHWACGCVTWTQGQVFYLETCAQGRACPVVQIAIKESREAGNEIMWSEHDTRAG